MKLYGAPMPAPNPRRVRIFLAEKGIDLPETPVDMRKREHKSADFRAKNSMGQLPALELDDGTCISETVAICRYFEETHPEPPLFGRTAVEALSRELAGERSFTESMRAQQHEFKNRIQGIAGLLELGRVDEALAYVDEIRGVTADLDQVLRP